MIYISIIISGGWFTLRSILVARVQDTTAPDVPQMHCPVRPTRGQQELVSGRPLRGEHGGAVRCESLCESTRSEVGEAEWHRGGSSPERQEGVGAVGVLGNRHGEDFLPGVELEEDFEGVGVPAFCFVVHPSGEEGLCVESVPLRHCRGKLMSTTVLAFADDEQRLSTHRGDAVVRRNVPRRDGTVSPCREQESGLGLINIEPPHGGTVRGADLRCIEANAALPFSPQARLELKRRLGWATTSRTDLSMKQ